MEKKGIEKLAVLLILSSILLLPLISSAGPTSRSCGIFPRTECLAKDGNYVLMGLSSQTNSHGELAPGIYNYVLCCNGGSGNTACTGANKIIGLSSEVNAHAESPTQNNYLSNNSVCYEDFSCASTTASCSENYPVGILSLSSITNAHIGGINDYSIKICCRGSLTAGECRLDSDSSSAIWKTTQAIAGETVNLELANHAGCVGKNMDIQVKKKGGIFGDPNEGSPFPTSYVQGANGAIATPSWLVPNDAKEGDKFYFIASSVSPTSSIQSSNMLEILNPDFCADNGILSCSDYATPENCNNDETLCEVVDAEINGITQDPSFCLTHNCYCSWDDAGNVCGAHYGTSQTLCGNGVKEIGEECDLGLQNGGTCSSCSSGCTDIGIDPSQCGGCPQGTTLCSDGTCSANCRKTDEDFSACNYNDICESNEGCSCKDCDTELDTCSTGLLCSIIGDGNSPACCNNQLDGTCSSECSASDPDCDEAVCGDGKIEFEEKCDDGNSASNDGCSSTCVLEEITPTNNQCPEGTTLCNNGKCSLNCFATDAGIKKCDEGGCLCQEGLIYEEIDLACCNPNSNDVCNPYCTYMDPDCKGDISELEIGNCRVTQTIEKDCDTEPKGYKTLSWTGIWTPAEGAKPTGPAYDFCVAGGKVTVPCPALVQLPFFDYLELIGSVIVIALVYVGLFFKRKLKRK